ncbi:hypothetical protein ASPZODRAFT_677832 [Penicilliopsis zonata CBS 506.65]|uniref:Zn(2)-C6 fungal-type domain-containing protein n=1 Tax=Penicilliopsis zonata CBS 506.65 TaxID=1073090 RepID=A0A1L9SDF2_9EURO|nr:hypothetical protein ASPZODRAFT_677832 [Penicilliopsis zonata CBS 506.65]OJJ45117.1 hypothetical protein ASPZODRAFT_677832 [Penicilliopsis zonata CBS 506.65]
MALQKHSCTTCARRKIKCDKLSPCSSCTKTRRECVYHPPAQSQRHRKRPADEDLLSRISEYEDLLRKHHVPFQPFDNSWIPSPLERLVVATPEQPQRVQCPAKEVQKDLRQSDASRLWGELPKELRDLSIDSFTRPKDPDEDAGTALSSSLLIPVTLHERNSLLERHPQPRHIFALWQAFAENVCPLAKIVHTPTLQQQIFETSWRLETATRPLEALLFAIYALAITSTNTGDCIRLFGETRSVLLHRYRSAAAEALIAADLHATRDLQVLQAFVLFLLVNPRSDLSVTSVAMAVRIGQMMGVNTVDPEISFFEQELRLRLWWQILELEQRARRRVFGLRFKMTEYVNLPLPTNLNDAELHPNMGKPSFDGVRDRPTDMLFCLVRSEIVQYLHVEVPINAIDLVFLTTPDGMAQKRKAVNEIQRIIEDKYLLSCDANIPFHHLCITAILARNRRMASTCLKLNKKRFLKALCVSCNLARPCIPHTTRNSCWNLYSPGRRSRPWCM